MQARSHSEVYSAITLFFFILITFVVQGELNWLTARLDPPFVEPSEQFENTGIKNAKVFQFFTFGHLPSAVDWIWIMILEDPTLTPVPAGRHPQIYYNLMLATDLDPSFFEAYQAGGNILSVIRDDSEGARDLLLKGLAFANNELPNYPSKFAENYWRYKWELPLLLGYIYLFELNDMPSAARYFQAASRVEGAPYYLNHLRERLLSPGGQYEVGLKLLNFLISTTAEKDKKLKEGLESKRSSLFVNQFLFRLREDFARFLRERIKEKKEYTAFDRIQQWERFRINNGIPAKDPWGGELKMTDAGEIITSTPHQKVFGLE